VTIASAGSVETTMMPRAMKAETDLRKERMYFPNRNDDAHEPRAAAARIDTLTQKRDERTVPVCADDYRSK
jgi:hypothetical protein